jgi:large subunit ribosomal protein L6
MSRLGKLPVALPEGIKAKIEDGRIIVSGKKGELAQALHRLVKVELKDNSIMVSVEHPEVKRERALWGLYRSLVKNMVAGVSEGFSKELEINGVGYRASLSGKKLILNVGYSHPIEFVLPEGIDAKVEANRITVNGADKQLVGETAARIRRLRKPEPYKGKGIKYVDEIIRRKEGKTAGKGEK